MRNNDRRPESQMVSHCCLEPEENLWHGMSQIQIHTCTSWLRDTATIVWEVADKAASTKEAKYRQLARPNSHIFQLLLKQPGHGATYR